MDNCNKFTFAQVRYLICLFRLSQNGYGLKNIDIAGALGHSRPSVHNMLKFLSDLGMVKQKTFGLAYLTEQGRLLAEKYAYCFDLLAKTISQAYGEGTASENAICGLLADMPPEKIDELYSKRAT